MDVQQVIPLPEASEYQSIITQSRPAPAIISQSIGEAISIHIPAVNSPAASLFLRVMARLLSISFTCFLLRWSVSVSVFHFNYMSIELNAAASLN